MAKIRKKLNLNDALLQIKEHLLLLPGNEDRQRITQSITEIQRELETYRENINHFPDTSEMEQLSSAITTLASFFETLKDRPLLAKSLFPKQAKAKKPKSSAIDIAALLQQLEELSTEQIPEQLTKHKKDTLLELSSKMNITANKKLTKDAIADKIFKVGFANKRGYDLLKG
ncbi:MAG: hypothetical protein JETT_1023 [Candidatus Jettenia ecosi]|uniref:Uncharacterized protein n=1 Tax=Candidatus Jettenia ecosi TaxID=2494326 RepID=A0A533QQ14_9BACT|nr:MAG: hypothetical protein JETT_1023 [Candidatus Jettenia ecosi]